MARQLAAEIEEVVEAIRGDVMEPRRIDRPVLMRDEIAQTGRRRKPLSQQALDRSPIGERTKHFAVRRRNGQPSVGEPMTGQIDAS